MQGACAYCHDNGIQVNGSFVLGFDHDRKDVFARTAEWVEQNRLECATFPHSDAVSRDAAVPPDGGDGPPAAPRLVALRHRARCVSPEAHDP